MVVNLIFLIYGYGGVTAMLLSQMRFVVKQDLSVFRQFLLAMRSTVLVGMFGISLGNIHSLMTLSLMKIFLLALVYPAL